MRRVVGAGAAALAVAGFPCAATAQAPAAAIEKWNEMSAAVLSGRTLSVLDTETVRVRDRAATGAGPVAFTYYKTEAVSVGLTANRRRFARAVFDSRVVVRTSIGSFTGSRLVGDATGHLLVVAGSRGFAPPVVWCCTRAGVEVAVESSGLPDAPRAIAAGFDGGRVRVLLRDAAGGVTLASASPAALQDPDGPDATRTGAAFPGVPMGSLAVVTDGRVAWVEAGAPSVVRLGVPSDTGVGDLTEVSVRFPVTGMWATPGTLVLLTRAGDGTLRVVRVDGDAAPRTVWAGRTTPLVAVGGSGTVVVADGRTVLASRNGTVAPVARAGGVVAAVAADRDRVAWLERRTRVRGAQRTRWTVARLAVVP